MGKTVLITGGGRGLGRSTAEALARAGHRVLFTVRREADGERTCEALRAAVPDARVEWLLADLASLAQVRTLCASLEERGLALDVLLSSAGIMQQSPTRRLTVDGLEETLGVNAVAPFLLVHGLLPALRRAPRARIIFVSSRLHEPGSRGVQVDFSFEHPNLERNYHPERAYKNSKLATLWLTYELHRRLRKRGLTTITSNAVCPGFVPVTAAASVKGFQRFFLQHVLTHMPFARTVAEATDSFVFMAVDPSLDGVSGGFYGEKQPLRSSPESYDEEKARRFCEWARGVTGLEDWP